MYKPIERVSRPDLDYFTFSDYFAQSTYKASAYIDSTGLADVMAYRHFTETNDWNNALFHARRALEKGAHERESRLMCVRALRSLGRTREALEVLHKGADDSHGTRLLEVGILVDLRRFSEASELIGRYLREAPPDVRVQLESILETIRAKPENN
jgi:hypothetical protein